MANTARAALLSLFLLSISTGYLRGDQTPQKPSDWERQLEMLRAVPYLAFSEIVVDESEVGVAFYDWKKVSNGYNLYCSRMFGEAFLLDMDGQVVHLWKFSRTGRGSPCHVTMLENGDLLVIKKFQELLRLNMSSDTIWRKRLEVHHDVAQAPDGSLYVVLREFRTHRGLKMRFAAIAHLKGNGEEISRWSSYENLDEIKNIFDTRSFLDTILDNILGDRGGRSVTSLEARMARNELGLKRLDYFHLNSIQVLPATVSGEGDDRFQSGNLLVCFRNVNQIAVLEKETYRVLWAWGEDELEWPHHPTMLANGHILIFDNGVQREYSRVVEMDPLTGAIVWEYVSEPPEDFYSFSRGSAQRLPNGNTLICESDKGRVFEVTEGREVVWIWFNPAFRDRHRELVYRMLRLPSAQVDELLKRWWWWD